MLQSFYIMKRFLLLTLIFLSFFCTHAQVFWAKEFDLSLEPFFLKSHGTLNEIFYQSKAPSKKRSLLEWQKDLFFYGLSIETKYKNFSLSTSFSSSFHEKSGKMYDSDWLNENDFSMKTTYSWGVNNAKENYNALLKINYDIPLHKNFTIEPTAQFQYKYDSFYRKRGAQGRYAQAEYSSDGKDHWWYEDEAKVFPTERYWSEEKQAFVRQGLAQIDYKSHSVFVWTGLNLNFYKDYFLLSLQGAVSPYMYLSSKDKHYNASDGTIYHLIQDDFFSAFKIALKNNIKLTKTFELTFLIEYISSLTIRGDLYYGWAKNHFQSSGASIEEKNASIGLKINGISKSAKF